VLGGQHHGPIRGVDCLQANAQFRADSLHRPADHHLHVQLARRCQRLWGLASISLHHSDRPDKKILARAEVRDDRVSQRHTQKCVVTTERQQLERQDGDAPLAHEGRRHGKVEIESTCRSCELRVRDFVVSMFSGRMTVGLLVVHRRSAMLWCESHLQVFGDRVRHRVLDRRRTRAIALVRGRPQLFLCRRLN
jgi:hypothetical protein